MNRYAAVDIGGTTIKFGVLEESGAFLEKRTCPTPPGEQILPAVLALVEDALKRWHLKGVAVSSTGVVDCETGDIVVVTKSKRAAEHMLESCRKFLERKLKLTMNLQKSKVVSLFSHRNFKFLGCCLGKNGRGIYIRVHRNSLRKAKQKLKELTGRSQGRNVRIVMAKVKEFIRGWIGYFYIADMKRILQRWNEWLALKMRESCIVQQKIESMIQMSS